MIPGLNLLQTATYADERSPAFFAARGEFKDGASAVRGTCTGGDRQAETDELVDAGGQVD